MSDPVVGVGLSRRQEPFGAIALALALIVMILPIESEILWTLHREGKTSLERLIWLACLLLVAVPLFVSWRRLRHQPDRWRPGKENLILTAGILALNVILLVIALWCDVI